jgi:integrase
VGQRRPFTPREIQAIRYALEQENNARDLALFNTAIDTMLRASDLLALKVEDVTDHGPQGVYNSTAATSSPQVLRNVR